MISNSGSQDGKNSIDNAFRGIPLAKSEAAYIREFLNSRDFSPHTVRAMIFDLKKFLAYFITANNERFNSGRVTVMDVSGFKKELREKKRQAVSTVNRALVTIRRYLDWLVDHGHIEVNPGKLVKELRKQKLVPKGLDRPQVRKLLRETELRNDTRAQAIFAMFLNTGCRVGDLVRLQVQDIVLGERSGFAVFRCGKGGKERQVPLPLAARKAMQEYLLIRPPIQSDDVFIGERGPLSDIGVRALCRKYSAICGFKLHPHLCRHTFAKAYLEATQNDLVSLAAILGHTDLNTCRLYCAKGFDQIAEQAERLTY